MTPSGENARIRGAVADALWTADEGAGWNMSVETRDEYLERADTVLRALGETYLAVVARDDVEGVIDWWRGANEAPGGCSFQEAIAGMGEYVWRLHQALGGSPDFGRSGGAS